MNDGLQWSVASWGLEHLDLHQVPPPAPAPGEVVLRFHAASLNYRDLLVLQGAYNPKFPLPLIPGSDGFGQIVDLGQGVERHHLGRFALTCLAPQWKSGEPVAETLRQTLGGPRPGVLTEYQSFRLDDLVLLDEPSALTPQEWAALPCAGVTAWNCLVDHARLEPGQTVLLLGTGGVSLFGLQIARMLGARVLLLSSSAQKRERALELGADAVGDYRAPLPWSDWVLRETEGQGVDVVLETGGSGTLAQSIRSTKIGGHISLIGVLSGSQEPLNILPLMMKALRVQGVVVGHQDHLRRLVRAYLQSYTRPVVDSSFPLRELPAALHRLQSGAHFGKVTITYPALDSQLAEPHPVN